MNKNEVITARGLCKTYPGGVLALDGLDLTVERGSVYGLIGRNGAGKTTALRILMGLLPADAGQAHILGQSYAQADEELRCRAAYVSQETALPRKVGVAELGAHLACYYPEWDQSYLLDMAGRFRLPTGDPIGFLSGGQRRIAAVVLALAARTEVLLLDEPAAGLDPVARRGLLDELVEILSLREESTILLSTHLLHDVERLADQVGIVEEGRLLEEACLDELRESTRKVQVIFPGDAPPADFTLPGAIRYDVSGPVVQGVVRTGGDDPLAVLRTREGVRVQEFSLSLEDLFLELLGEAEREEEVVR